MGNLEWCEGVQKVFCHLGLCHAFIPFKYTSNDVYALSVMKSCAAGYVKVGFEKNSKTNQSIKK